MRSPRFPLAAGRGRACVLATAGLSGAVLLRWSFSAKADSRRFYGLTAALASTWTAGALLTSAKPGGSSVRGSLEADVARPALTGAATFALFYAAAGIVRRNPVLHRSIASVLHYADRGTTPAVLLTASVNAVAEEWFFRGALWDAGGAHPLATTAVAYTAVTTASGNPALVVAGAITSVIFGRERARSGGAVAPAIAHLTWSALMLTCLPPLFRPPTGQVANAAGRTMAARCCRSGSWR